MHVLYYSRTVTTTRVFPQFCDAMKERTRGLVSFHPGSRLSRSPLEVAVTQGGLHKVCATQGPSLNRSFSESLDGIVFDPFLFARSVRVSVFAAFEKGLRLFVQLVAVKSSTNVSVTRSGWHPSKSRSPCSDSFHEIMHAHIFSHVAAVSRHYSWDYDWSSLRVR